MNNWVKKTVIVFTLFLSGLGWAACQPQIGGKVRITKPDSLYIDHVDGTVTDTVTGLMWAKCQFGKSGDQCDTGGLLVYTWSGVLDMVVTANDTYYLGYNDWRLPSVKELGSLVERSCQPPINSTLFPSTALSDYWTASLHAGNSNYIWTISFNEGFVEASNKFGINRARLVRGGW